MQEGVLHLNMYALHYSNSYIYIVYKLYIYYFFVGSEITIYMYIYIYIYKDAIQLIHRVGSAQHHLKERVNNN